MRATASTMRAATRAGQAYVERVPFSVSVIVVYVIVCISVAAIVYVASFTNFEIGAHAPISLYARLLLAFLSTSLILTGLARLIGLKGLVGLTTRLATSTA
jgi:hypothetical protein